MKVGFKILGRDPAGVTAGNWFVSYIGFEPQKYYFEFEKHVPDAYAWGTLRAGTLLIGNVEVKPKFRRKGLGRIVVLNLIKHAKRMGATDVRAWSIKKGGVAFWQKMGIKGNDTPWYMPKYRR
jgi:GNAT superfamily N-acetyltransferase